VTFLVPYEIVNPSGYLFSSIRFEAFIVACVSKLTFDSLRFIFILFAAGFTGTMVVSRRHFCAVNCRQRGNVRHPCQARSSGACIPGYRSLVFVEVFLVLKRGIATVKSCGLLLLSSMWY
jgi:hypothetical protein